MSVSQSRTAMEARQPDVMNAATKKTNRARKVEFHVKAAEGSKVFLAGSFNNWDPQATQLKPNGDSTYKASVRLTPGRHEYKFVVNGRWQIDEQCKQWVPNSYGSLNSVIEVESRSPKATTASL